MISVALTTYNGERYLNEMLDSLLKQTLLPDEIVVCDDCSTDRTWQILSEYKEREPRFCIFQNEKNLGFKKNFEKTISLCKGEFIALADQDDIWLDTHIQILYEAITSGDYDLACGDNDICNEKEEPSGVTFFQSNLFSLKKYPTNKDIFLKMIFSGGCLQGASMILRKTFALSALPIPLCVNSHDFWFASLSAVNGKLKIVEKSVTLYRQHGEQITRNKSIGTSRYELLEILKQQGEHSKNTGINFSQISEYFKHVRKTGRFILARGGVWNKYYRYIFPDQSIWKRPIRFIKFLLKNT